MAHRQKMIMPIRFRDLTARRKLGHCHRMGPLLVLQPHQNLRLARRRHLLVRPRLHHLPTVVIVIAVRVIAARAQIPTRTTHLHLRRNNINQQSLIAIKQITASLKMRKVMTEAIAEMTFSPPKNYRLGMCSPKLEKIMKRRKPALAGIANITLMMMMMHITISTESLIRVEDSNHRTRAGGIIGHIRISGNDINLVEDFS
mmetsp:Transcript_31366/g.75807  ORF Transcript_31366/g.75807 Transcript_31366/m.75807 type:complete len:201 (-) Transcript_31366:111-713(-)